MDELEIRPVHGFLVVLVSEETHVMALTEVNNAVGSSYHVVDVMSGDVASRCGEYIHTTFFGVSPSAMFITTRSVQDCSGLTHGATNSRPSVSRCLALDWMAAWSLSAVFGGIPRFITSAVIRQPGSRQAAERTGAGISECPFAGVAVLRGDIAIHKEPPVDSRCVRARTVDCIGSP